MDLRTLTSLSGVSGNEYEVRSAIIKELESMGISYECDVLGNVIPGRATRAKVLVDAHMDEWDLSLPTLKKTVPEFRPVGSMIGASFQAGACRQGKILG